MMVFADLVQRYLTSTQHNVQYFLETRGQHHLDLERLPPTGAASSSTAQHDAGADADAAHNRAWHKCHARQRREEFPTG